MQLSKSKSVLIAGNGLSLAAIDYSRLPRNITTWRVNRFFFEQKYYVGKKVDAFFLGGSTNTEIYGMFLACQLAARNKEYIINLSNVFATVHIHKRYPFPDPVATIIDSAVKCGYSQIVDYYTSSIKKGTPGHIGVYAIAYAALTGYNHIYITGIDNDYSKGCYPWKPEIVKDMVNFDEARHPQEVQTKHIVLLTDIPNVKLYSVSPSSPISRHIELAPIINEYPEGYVPPDKPEGYVKDIVKINMLEPPVSPLEVRYEQLAKAVNSLTAEIAKQNGAQVQLSVADNDLKTEAIRQHNAQIQLSAVVNDLKTEVVRQNNAQVQLFAAINDLKTETVQQNNAQVQLSAAFSRYIDETRRYPKSLVLFVCCFIPSKAKRKALREKYARGCGRLP